MEPSLGDDNHAEKMAAPDRASGSEEKTAGVQLSARTWRRPSGKESEGLDAPRELQSGGTYEKKRWNERQSDFWLQPERSANQKYPFTRPKASPRPWVDSCPDPSAHGRGGKASEASGSTDPFPTAVDPEQFQMAAQVKEMDAKEIVALSRSLGGSWFPKSGAQVILKELRKRGLEVPSGFEPLPVKDEERSDESPGRPPSY